VLGAGARDVCSTSEDLPGLAELLRHRISSANHARADRLRSAATEAWDRASQRHRSMTLRLETLSTREMSILSALDRGNAVPKIAARWGVSDKAMHSEVATILDKLGVDSPDEACTTLRELDDWFHA
jgi:DNA-binding NarL/FixJ family response regulator